RVLSVSSSLVAAEAPSWGAPPRTKNPPVRVRGRVVGANFNGRRRALPDSSSRGLSLVRFAQFPQLVGYANFEPALHRPVELRPHAFGKVILAGGEASLLVVRVTIL